MGTMTTQFENGVECSLEKVVTARNQHPASCRLRFTKNGWRGSGVSCSATVSVRDKRWRSIASQFQLWRWMKTTNHVVSSLGANKETDATCVF